MVDLVRASVVQVFTLEVNLRATKLIGQALGVKNGAGAAHVIGKQRSQLILKILALDDFLIGGRDFIHAFLQVWWHQLAAVGAKKALGIRHGLKVFGHLVS